ncbi:MAG: shikimate dehydrogenase [Bacillota bacterium]
MIGASTRAAAVLGHPVRHTLSPVMHNSALSHLGLDAVYLALDPGPCLGDSVRTLARCGFVGFNITVPFKEDALASVDWLDPTARALQCVNVIKRDEGALEGYNTDVYGVQQSLKEADIELRGRRVVILGAGGAARAAAYACCKAGAREVVVVNRNRHRAEQLCRLIVDWGAESSAHALKWPLQVEADLFVNASTLGLTFHQEVTPYAQAVLDMVYSPGNTELVRSCRKRGVPCVSGLSVLLWQGVEAFSLLFGAPAPVDIMREALDRATGGDAW